MAYMSQEKKKEIAAALKRVVPNDWKYTLGVRNHSTIVLKIRKAPVDFVTFANAHRKKIAEYTGHPFYEIERGSFEINQYAKLDAYPEDVQETLTKIIAALNIGNHDRSDIQSDYFDVGWYVDLQIGEWNKPFEFTGQKEVEAA